MRRRGGVILSAAVLVIGVVACARPPIVPTLPAPPPAATTERPNVVRIMTDDQDVSSMQVMTKTKALLAARGVTYTNSTVTLSLCCPSRATALTGQYTHNHNVWDNGGKQGGYLHFTGQDNTLASWLRAAGYSTAHVGKYMNQYSKAEATKVPPGWDRWFNIVDEATEAYPYYGYTVSDQGTLRTYGTADEDYATDVFTERALADVRSLAAGDAPFFLDFWPTAPHYGRGRSATTHMGPAVAPRYEQANPGIRAPRPTNFRPGGADPAPAALRSMGVLYEMSTWSGGVPFVQLLDASYRDYVNSLLSVDDAVERLIDELSASGELANTYIIFTSDNGLMWGNHGLTNFKWEPYEESLRVPLIVVGPGVPQGVTSRQPVSNIDIVPTILAVTGAQAGRVVDGTSLLPYQANPPVGTEQAVLIESNMIDPASVYQFNGYTVVRYKGVHTDGFQYTEWMDGYVELYDLKSDPGQMRNRANDPLEAANRARLATALRTLQRCAGPSCNVAVAGLTHPAGGPFDDGSPTIQPMDQGAAQAVDAAARTGGLDIPGLAPAGGFPATAWP
jgi:N-acetylglucosamine-6-sulfatase